MVDIYTTIPVLRARRPTFFSAALERGRSAREKREGETGALAQLYLRHRTVAQAYHAEGGVLGTVAINLQQMAVVAKHGDPRGGNSQLEHVFARGSRRDVPKVLRRHFRRGRRGRRDNRSNLNHR